MARFVTVLTLVCCAWAVKALSRNGTVIAEPHSIPYQADLIIEVIDDDTRYRTGSLISPNYVLTAANCVVGSSNITVVMGVYNAEDKEEPTRRTYVGDTYVVHPSYNQSTGYHDIAVIHLKDSAEVNEFVQPVILPRHRYKDLIGQQAQVSGWGNVSAGCDLELSKMRYANITIGSPSDCLPQFPHPDSAQMCPVPSDALFHVTDFGAPLVLNDVQIGIAAATSFTNGIESNPQIYTRVDHYLSWINNNTDVKIKETC
ncbi:hypothetical protein PPYR_13619 [Photinus pyralis]|uniref:Peptidase S1 domain-containing protein n=2 Tax=Photinus pyralis TaxID=7054 RepID=A0A5N4A9N3_PHOPY|nr:mast cell protease 1A-like [Photinus pyralis]KAB0793999.1 hypothetical protein PPYR_13619 [Photinus pyralis]